MFKSLIACSTCALLLGCATTPADPARHAAIGNHLKAMHGLLLQARSSAEDAGAATTVVQVKHYTDEVLETVWGYRAGINGAAAESLGWRSRWQTTYTEFDPAFSARYGSAPGAVTEVAQLGLVGRGRSVRRALAELAPASYPAVTAPLNNVIGWQRLDDGVTKAERQPRIDLTYLWDAEQSFWTSQADTGWIFVLAAQAINILKTDYDDNLPLARAHAAVLVELVDQCLTGVDHNGDGEVTATAMEGGLLAMLTAAQYEGLL